MDKLTSKETLIVNEWKTRRKEYENAKKALKDVLDRHGLASKEFNTARVEFEMLKEEFDAFEKENHAIIVDYQ